MTDAQYSFWEKVEAFNFDRPDTRFTFSQRLARENGWTPRFAQRVIAEYKRFMFLCCIQAEPCTPSDAVDQAWHLHMTYTRSYWRDFCGQTLGREIHHDPTEGGAKEASKFEQAYTATLKAYSMVFGEYAPEDVWPPAAERFAPRQFQRVDTGQVRLLRKEGLTGQGALAGYAVSIFAVVFLIIAPNWLHRLALLGLLVLIGLLIVDSSLVRPGKRGRTRQQASGQRQAGCSGGDGTWLILTGAGGHDHGDAGGHDGGSDAGGDSGCGSGCSGCGGCGGD